KGRRRIFGAHAAHLRVQLLGCSLTHVRCARCAARRFTRIWATWIAESLVEVFGRASSTRRLLQCCCQMAQAAKLKHKKNGQRPSPNATLSRKDYDKELRRLQVELVQLEEWIRHRGLRVVVLFEGRDTAGKGGLIKRMTAL